MKKRDEESWEVEETEADTISFKTEKSLYKRILFAVVGTIFVLSSLAGGSSNGVFTQFYSAENAFLKNSWRMQVSALYLILPVFLESRYKPFNWR